LDEEKMKQLQDRAVSHFCTRPSNFPTGRPYNCCESVLLALKDHLGLASDIVPKVATAIGAGVSLNGLLCGCISSVAMAIGMRYGRSKPEESPKPAWDMVNKYVAEFKEKFGGVDCRELTGLNLKTDEGLKQYYAKVHDYACADRLRFAVERAMKMH